MPRLVRSLLPAVALALIAPAADAATPRGLTLIATQTASKQGTKSITFRETLVSGKKVVGHDQVTCTQATKASLRCVATFTLAKGVIHVAGSVFYAKAANTLTITRGSGGYKAAKGTLTLRDLTSKTTAETFTFR
jgi:hypothetical protein